MGPLVLSGIPDMELVGKGTLLGDVLQNKHKITTVYIDKKHTSRDTVTYLCFSFSTDWIEVTVTVVQKQQKSHQIANLIIINK